MTIKSPKVSTGMRTPPASPPSSVGSNNSNVTDEGFVDDGGHQNLKRRRRSSAASDGHRHKKSATTATVPLTYLLAERDKIWADVNIGNYKKNIAVMRDVLRRTHGGAGVVPDIMAVVKSDAYGHSVPIITTAAMEVGVRRFAVATLAEAIALRQHIPVGTVLPSSPNATIQVLLLAGCRTLEQVRLAWQMDLEFFLTSPEMAEQVSVWAKKILREEGTLGQVQGRRAIKLLRVHVKLDVGLSRLGVLGSDFDQAWSRMRRLHGEGIEIVGMCSHFGHAVDTNPRDHHLPQLEAFEAMRRKVLAPLSDSSAAIPESERAMLTGIEFHMNNSAATLLSIGGPVSRGGAFSRIGIALYGINPSIPDVKCLADIDAQCDAPAPALHPVMSVRARLASVKDVPAGNFVGYGDKYQVPTTDGAANSSQRVAVVEAGYSDGIPVTLGSFGKGYFLINGKRARILGNVCMNYTMIEIPEDAGDVQPGSVVTLIGKDGDEEVTPGHWERWLDGHVHQYSVVLGLGSQMPRYRVE